jgi:hypothetical protein
MEGQCLESMGVAIYRNRENLRNRQRVQLIEICNICRLVSDYNGLMGRLSPQEKGLFRSETKTAFGEKRFR